MLTTIEFSDHLKMWIFLLECWQFRLHECPATVYTYLNISHRAILLCIFLYLSHPETSSSFCFLFFLLMLINNCYSILFYQYKVWIFSSHDYMFKLQIGLNTSTCKLHHLPQITIYAERKYYFLTDCNMGKNIHLIPKIVLNIPIRYEKEFQRKVRLITLYYSIHSTEQGNSIAPFIHTFLKNSANTKKYKEQSLEEVIRLGCIKICMEHLKTCEGGIIIHKDILLWMK